MKRPTKKKLRAPVLSIDVLTLFPNIFRSPLRESILRIGQEKGLVKVRVHDLRKYTHDKRRTCDDKPFGGGPGMVMTASPIAEAFDNISTEGQHKIFLSPDGKPFTQDLAARLAKTPKILLLCGHYEGVDERVRAHLIDEEISVGDYVTSGGEIPALIIIDALVRLVPGVLGNDGSLEHESFNNGKLDYPHYTRPQVFRGWKVPDILVSGNHAEVESWRSEQAFKRTQERRADLLNGKQ